METEKPQNVVLLHQEGIFYIAYEHSAWLFVTAVHALKVKKQYVKCVSQHVASIGFPMTSLGKWVAEEQVVVEGSVARVVLPADVACGNGGFDEWKAALPVDAANGKPVGKTVAGDTACNADVPALIRNFPIENKTPLECMIFLSEIKQLLK